ncbi:pheromone-processing carboxypeptidase KEX1-like [Helianthus annuus]|uniref:pheromone-processing carboxypeptidase KEX1-like n=1 Tax=Helianthus annuus TaxID=4232 RepID=UPI000B8F4745|nr:pheromone-processing carboxypeptidase KEX1-like [Helianthus annuus]
MNAADVEVNVAEVEVNEENSLVPSQLFVLVGELKSVYYSREVNVRRIEIERRRLKAKEAKKAQVDEKVDEEKDDEDEEDDDMKDIDDFYESDDDKGDDNDQGGNGGALIVRPPGGNRVNDYLDDTLNGEREESLRGSLHQFKHLNLQIFILFLIIFEDHQAWIPPILVDRLISLFDPAVRDLHVFKFVEDANDFNDVIVEDDSSDSDQDVPFHYAGQDDNFSTFA